MRFSERLHSGSATALDLCLLRMLEAIITLMTLGKNFYYWSPSEKYLLEIQGLWSCKWWIFTFSTVPKCTVQCLLCLHIFLKGGDFNAWNNDFITTSFCVCFSVKKSHEKCVKKCKRKSLKCLWRVAEIMELMDNFKAASYQWLDQENSLKCVWEMMIYLLVFCTHSWYFMLRAAPFTPE